MRIARFFVFYAALFARHPRLESRFRETDMRSQTAMLVIALQILVHWHRYRTPAGTWTAPCKTFVRPELALMTAVNRVIANNRISAFGSPSSIVLLDTENARVDLAVSLPGEDAIVLLDNDTVQSFSITS